MAKKNFVAQVSFPGKLYALPQVIEVESSDDENARKAVMAIFTSDSNARIDRMWEVARKVPLP